MVVSAGAWHSVGCRTDRLGTADPVAIDREILEFWENLPDEQTEPSMGLVEKVGEAPGMVAPIGAERVQAPGCP